MLTRGLGRRIFCIPPPLSLADATMSLSLRPPDVVPAMTAEVAHAASSRGNRYLTLCDTFGPRFIDEDFAELYPHHGPCLSARTLGRRPPPPVYGEPLRPAGCGRGASTHGLDLPSGAPAHRFRVRCQHLVGVSDPTRPQRGRARAVRSTPGAASSSRAFAGLAFQSRVGPISQAAAAPSSPTRLNAGQRSS